MLNSTPKSRRKQIIIVIIFLVLLSFVIFVYRDSKPILAIQGVIQSVFSGPKSFLYSLGRGDEKSEISRLKQEKRSIEQKMVDYELLKKDNEALKSQFDISGETTQSLIAAKIIGFAGSASTPTQFIINVGKKNNVQSGMTVIFQKYLVGKVLSASQNYSVVITPFNENFKVLAKLPKTNANGILVGKNDFMLFDGVVITDTLEVGSEVVTKGEVDQNGVGIVPDMILGKISSISKNEAAPFQSAQLAPMVEYSKLVDVFVIAQM